MHFALFNNLALIHDGWKIATAYSQPWQLYDLKNDRTETRDLAQERPEKLAELLAMQKTFFERPDVRLRLQSGEREPEYAPPFKSDGTRGPGAREDVPDEAYALLLIKARAEGRQPTEAEMAKLKQQAAGKGDSADVPSAKKKMKKTK